MHRNAILQTLTLFYPELPSWYTVSPYVSVRGNTCFSYSICILTERYRIISVMLDQALTGLCRSVKARELVSLHHSEKHLIFGEPNSIFVNAITFIVIMNCILFIHAVDPAWYTGVHTYLPGPYGVECQTKCPLDCSFHCYHSTWKCSDHTGMNSFYLS